MLAKRYASYVIISLILVKVAITAYNVPTTNNLYVMLSLTLFSWS